MGQGKDQDWGAAPPRQRGWYVKAEPGRLVESRHWPPRFDVVARQHFPVVERRSRLARAVRQDLWRQMQHLRGFSPVIEITNCGEGMSIRAGGRLNSRAPCDTDAKIAALLSSPSHRARWQAWARTGGGR